MAGNLTQYRSWGGYPRAQHVAVARPAWRDQLAAIVAESGPWLPFGNGRSYGDVCLNDGGKLIDMRGLDRFIAFDDEQGIVHCEAGTLLAEILALAVPRGWFVQVTPGTRFVTVGGAIANDVHGKNHHRVGSFGCHVRALTLLRSDGTLLHCSREENSDWFAATIGGLGLTGTIVSAELQLRRITSPLIRQQSIRMYNLREFFELSAESERDYEYTVSWIDCLAQGANMGRGWFFRGNHATGTRGPTHGQGTQLKFPIESPVSLVNHWSLRAFNALYYRKQWADRATTTVHYQPFFYPLDGILNWNRMYGKRGFLQYQCVVPPDCAYEATSEMLKRIANAGEGSFLVVLKVFGDKPSPGMLSFPRPGATLALDFPYRGTSTLALLNSLDEIVFEAGGALYPAKDARMSGAHFRASFPQWERFKTYIDPAHSSSLWRRVMQGEAS
ncbi:MAG: FAD-binding oxidoreductase [Zetaproteobacteria bacterium]|nr:MAG: FAD-binding oxidoreductase [Zetaproteobacteria bacterium]